jgi:HAD superfamily hydrolase (TIGR01549 family)
MDRRIPIFDLDGTLLDTDEALVAPFVALGVPRDAVTFGHVLADECARLGIDVDTYLDEYDPEIAQPFAGVDEVVRSFERWAVCSNKHPRYGRAELARLGWEPEVALFSDHFDGPKHLQPVLEAMQLAPDDVVFVGDTEHDRAVAGALGVPFGVAAWNPRAVARDGDVVLRTPADVVAFCATAVSSP